MGEKEMSERSSAPGVREGAWQRWNLLKNVNQTLCAKKAKRLVAAASAAQHSAGEIWKFIITKVKFVILNRTRVIDQNRREQ